MITFCTVKMFSACYQQYDLFLFHLTNYSFYLKLYLKNLVEIWLNGYKEKKNT